MDHIKKAIERAKAGRPATYAQSVETIATQHKDIGQKSVQDSIALLHADVDALEGRRIFARQGANAIGFDQLRTRVLGEMRDRGWRTLMITSPTIGCGKTTTAINLAMSMARQSEGFTILADLDLRKPQVAAYLEAQTEFDIYDLLTGKVGLSEVLFATDVSGPKLAFLPANKPAARPSEILSSSAMGALIKSLKAVSTVVIFDMPPILVADDVLALMPQVDGVLLVVAAGETKVHEAEEAQRAIPEKNFMGVVLSKSDEKINQYYN